MEVPMTLPIISQVGVDVVSVMFALAGLTNLSGRTLWIQRLLRIPEEYLPVNIYSVAFRFDLSGQCRSERQSRTLITQNSDRRHEVASGRLSANDVRLATFSQPRSARVSVKR
jgi:hypothetical protein